LNESHVSERRLAFVLDASALLAFLFKEPGSEFVREVLAHSVISAVNWTEVLQRLQMLSLELDGIEEDLTALGLDILPFTNRDAAATADLFMSTRSRGLSLGDRACLALARSRDMTALTADRAWLELRLPEIRIDRIR
jgi:ribonuclease VapC